MALVPLQSRPPAEKRSRSARVAIVASLYNEDLVGGLLRACETELTAIDPGIGIEVVRVPGAFEIPVAVARLARRGEADVLIALGVIIRGATAHADLIATSITHSLQSIAVETGIPVIHEVLLLSRAEAEERCHGTEINRGTEAARTAVSMADLFAQIGPAPTRHE